MDAGGIVEALKRLQVPHERIAAAIGRERSVATKLMNRRRRILADEIEPLVRLISEAQDLSDPLPPIVRSVADDPASEYASVQALPAFPGAPVTRALVPRVLLDQLGAKPQDLRQITIRGDAMTPMFCNGDEVLIDLRDCSAAQGGPFALWSGADDYTVRLVQRLRELGRIRIAAVNASYPVEEADTDQVRIMGRPVWLSRRL